MKLLIRTATFFFISLCFVKAVSAQVDQSRPKLMVGIVIDQMRQEYLYRFQNHFGEGGFKRLMNDGFVFKNVHLNYVPTETGPGHASIYTGTTPRVHGIIGNEWYDKKKKGQQNCVQDDKVAGVGGNTEGNRSPTNLLSSTMTDELRMASQGRSKVISISIKDRGAILPGGQNPTGVYWFDKATGCFRTSTYYAKELPNWVSKFNNLKWPEKYMKGTWNTLKPIEEYVESEPDAGKYEESFSWSVPPVFPYDLKKISEKENLYDKLSNTPFGNSLITEFVLSALSKEKMGRGKDTDFLAISYSSTDYIGHNYGPYSKEIQDTYIRMDLELERIFIELDKTVGKGEWTVFVTADHGVADIPNSLIEKKIPAGYWVERIMEPQIKKYIESKYNTPDLIEKFFEKQIYINRNAELLKNDPSKLEDVKSTIIEYLLTLKGVANVFDAQKTGDFNGSDFENNMISSSINPERSGDILFTLKPGWIGEKDNVLGTGHGSPYSYDTNIPLIFYGKGINQGSSSARREVTSIAPTVTTLLGIKLPSGCVGYTLPDVIDKP